uniref:BHLH domain-containing protein n=1 Tax=Sphaeramia orbicularis TaxID=375764 RepID=A0A672YPK1_9TELE
PIKTQTSTIDQKRDRINQSLSELRTLLLNSTCDPRLQNPKIEKAEILDLTVEYLQKWTKGTNEACSSSLFTIEGAGFQQCMARLSSYMHKITPEQRTHLMEGLKHHTENQQQRPHTSSSAAAFELTLSELPPTGSERKEEPPKLLFLPPSCSTPRHDYLSPPPSPWFSPLSTYATSPTFPSFACHFSFPPTSLSPPSAHNATSSTLPQPSHAIHTPTPALHLHPPRHPTQGEVSPPSSSIWRPWF